jgi:hypothetical protein
VKEKKAMDYTFIDDDGFNLEQSAVRKKESNREGINQIIVLDYDRM